jgi:hypothetical protein
VCALRSLKESENKSSGGIVPWRTHWSRPRKDLKRKHFEAEEIFQRREPTVKVRGGESRDPADRPIGKELRRSCPKAQERTGHRISAHRGSGFGVWRGKCFVTCQIANRDFPS